MADAQKVHRRPRWQDVLQAIDIGDIQPLSEYLRGSKGRINPAVASRVADLIDGTASDSSWQISIGRNPRLKGPKSKGRELGRPQRRRNLLIAFFIAEHETAAPGRFESACFEACQIFNVGRTTVTEAWKKHKTQALAVAKFNHDHGAPSPLLDPQRRTTYLSLLKMEHA